MALNAGAAGSAGAQAANEAGTVAGSALAGWIVAVVILALAIWLWRRAGQAAARLRHQRNQARGERDRLADLLTERPDVTLSWDDEGRIDGIERLAALLGGAASVRELADLQGLLDTADYGDLKTRIDALRAGGQGFVMAARSAAGERVLSIEGWQGRHGGGLAWRDVSGQHRAEQTLRARFDELCGLIDKAPFAAWRRDGDGRIAWCNTTYAALIGRAREDILESDGDGEGVELETRLTAGRARAMAAQARADGAPVRETRRYNVEGERRVFDVEELPDRGGGGGGTLGFAWDVGERESARGELQRHIDAHVEVLNTLGAAIVIFGPDKRVAFYNKAYARLYRFDEAWLASRPEHGAVLDAARDNRRIPEQADYPSFKRQVMALYRELLETDEGLWHLPDGTILRRIMTPHPFGGLMMMYEDVTDRFSMERSFNTLSAVQRETIDNLYEGIAVFGGDGRLKLFNPAYARIWQIDETVLAAEPHVGELIEQGRDHFSEAGDWSKLRDRLVAHVIDREARTGRMERPDGGIIDFASVPLPDGNMLFTYLDVTDSVRIERALRERAEALETADRLKSEFISSVSYELRTPLNVIIGFAEIMAQEYFGTLNERQREYASGILASSNALLALINDILDLASVEAGQMELEAEPVDLARLIEGVRTLSWERAQRAELDLQIRCADGLGAIFADERRLKQVLFNLLSNATKYTPAGGRITIEASRADGEVLLAVRDTGIGIDDDERAIVFESFRGGARARRHQGAGLGLSLVKNIIELHGGYVELESKLGAGTTVTCHLPLEMPDARPADAA